MNELEKLEKRKKSTRHILITVSVLFLFLMLVLPLLCIIASSLKEGFAFYMQSIRTDYVKSALKVTLIATVAAVVINTFFGLCVSWLLTKFSFRGKQVLATLIRAINQFFGTNIRIAFAIPGVILATVFVTFPYVSREVIPVLNAQGKDEEEAAALMGAGGLKIFFKITFPQMKWALLYGVILCTSRALGEFGAVNALSKTRGETFTLPLEIDALYMSGTEQSVTAAFAVSSLLVILAVIILWQF